VKRSKGCRPLQIKSIKIQQKEKAFSLQIPMQANGLWLNAGQIEDIPIVFSSNKIGLKKASLQIETQNKSKEVQLQARVIAKEQTEYFLVNEKGPVQIDVLYIVGNFNEISKHYKVSSKYSTASTKTFEAALKEKLRGQNDFYINRDYNGVFDVRYRVLSLHHLNRCQDKWYTGKTTDLNNKLLHDIKASKPKTSGYSILDSLKESFENTHCKHHFFRKNSFIRIHILTDKDDQSRKQINEYITFLRPFFVESYIHRQKRLLSLGISFFGQGICRRENSSCRLQVFAKYMSRSFGLRVGFSADDFIIFGYITPAHIRKIRPSYNMKIKTWKLFLNGSPWKTERWGQQQTGYGDFPAASQNGTRKEIDLCMTSVHPPDYRFCTSIPPKSILKLEYSALCPSN
jgi:hypothetical protein